MIRGRLRRHGDDEGDAGGGDAPAAESEYIDIDPRDLTNVFAVPQWLRDVGLTSWLLVGIALLLAGMIALLALTSVIVLPVIAASVVAAVASPLVAWLQRKGVPRGLGAALLMLAIIAAGVGIMLMVVGGITGQDSDISARLADAQDTLTGWLEDAGVDPATAEEARQNRELGHKRWRLGAARWGR